MRKNDKGRLAEFNLMNNQITVLRREYTRLQTSQDELSALVGRILRYFSLVDAWHAACYGLEKKSGTKRRTVMQWLRGRDH